MLLQEAIGFSLMVVALAIGCALIGIPAATAVFFSFFRKRYRYKNDRPFTATHKWLIVLLSLLMAIIAVSVIFTVIIGLLDATIDFSSS